MRYEAPAVEGRLELSARLGVIAIFSDTNGDSEQPVWRPAKPAKPKEA